MMGDILSETTYYSVLCAVLNLWLFMILITVGVLCWIRGVRELTKLFFPFVVGIALAVTLCSASSVQAQFPGPYPGGEVPVIDAGVRHSTAGIKHDTVIEVIKQTAMLADMLIQALRGHIAGSGGTGIYLDGQATARYGEALTYGADSSEIWPEQFTFDEPYPDGDYLEADLEQRRRVLDTHRTMQFLIENRQREFAADEEEINEAISAVNEAQGRNELAVGQAKVQVAHLQQSRKEQQLLMTIANQLAIEHSDRVNQEVKREAQERYFLSNGGEPVPPVEWGDPGIY